MRQDREKAGECEKIKGTRGNAAEAVRRFPQI